MLAWQLSIGDSIFLRVRAEVTGLNRPEALDSCLIIPKVSSQAKDHESSFLAFHAAFEPGPGVAAGGL